jgi:hypothetical protein
MDSDIELTIKDQDNLYNMLKTGDEETEKLAFSLISQIKKPGILINIVCGTEILSFDRYVRRHAKGTHYRLFGIFNPHPLSEEEAYYKKLLERLFKY